jgi:hypothetical protein
MTLWLILLRDSRHKAEGAIELGDFVIAVWR